MKTKLQQTKKSTKRPKKRDFQVSHDSGNMVKEEVKRTK